MSNLHPINNLEYAKRLPTPRQDIFDLYWIFAARRQEIFEKRINGLQPPWTADPILQQFKFCNVFRAADRVSQFLIRRVAYSATSDPAPDRIFRIVAFRTFSKPATWISLISKLGHEPLLTDLDSGAFEKCLDEIKTSQGGLYTGAFILCATKAFGYDDKHKNYVALFKEMFLKRDAGAQIQGARSLEEIVRFLESFPLIGPFMAYQIAIDLNYSDLVNFDENDFTQAGPGAMRGIRKVFTDLGDLSPAQAILWMVERQTHEFERLNLRFRGLWGRPLHAIDCQGLFCEIDKYCREAAPHLLSNRSRIKARFEASSESLPLFFPPKWGINNKLTENKAEPEKQSAQRNVQTLLPPGLSDDVSQKDSSERKTGKRQA